MSLPIAAITLAACGSSDPKLVNAGGQTSCSDYIHLNDPSPVTRRALNQSHSADDPTAISDAEIKIDDYCVNNHPHDPIQLALNATPSPAASGPVAGPTPPASSAPPASAARTSDVLVGCTGSPSSPTGYDELVGYDMTTGSKVFTRPMTGQSTSLNPNIGPICQLSTDTRSAGIGPTGYSPDFKQYVLLGGPDGASPEVIQFHDNQPDTAFLLGQANSGPNSFDVANHTAVAVAQDANGTVWWLDRTSTNYVVYRNDLSGGSTSPDVVQNWNLGDTYVSSSGAQGSAPSFVFGTKPGQVALTYTSPDTHYVSDGTNSSTPPFPLATYPAQVPPAAVQKLLNDPSANVFSAFYSLDRSTVYFMASDSSNKFSLYSVPATGGSATTVVTDLPPGFLPVGVTKSR